MPGPDTAAPASGDDPGAAAAGAGAPQPAPSATKGVARNTAIFSAATGLSRIAGLIREVVARGYFGTSGPASAFTFAFQLPNLVRSLFADAALSAAFVPIFTDLLEKDRKQDAFTLASTLFFCILAVLGFVTALFILLAGIIIPPFIPADVGGGLDALTVGLSRLLFPIVLLLGLNGLVVGILNAHGHFTVPALAPLVWNAVIIASLVALHGLFDGQDQIYAYAIGVLLGTLVQFVMVLPVLRRIDFRFPRVVNLTDPRIRQVAVLMLPVTIGLGIINFDQFVNTTIGFRVSAAAPTSIEAAFRIYMLPQGIFSVALASVLFPALSRLASRRDYDGLRHTMAAGVRQIFLMLVPAAVFMVVLAEPIVRLIYERGAFDAQSTENVKLALFWFTFSLPFAGVNLLLTRTFFSLQKPWIPARLAIGTLVINTLVTLALYERFGIPGLVIGTPIASLIFTLTQTRALRRLLGGSIEGRETALAFVRIAGAAAVMGAAALATHSALHELLGDAFSARLIAMGAASLVAAVVYATATLLLRIEEARRVERFLMTRVRARRAAG